MVREGIPFILIPVVIAAGLGWFGLWPVAVVFAAVALFMMYFFRDPQREVPQDDGLIVSAADGVVTRIDLTDSTKLVSVFLSPMDVHINRSPITGTIMTDNPPRARSRGLKTPYSVAVAAGTRERALRSSTIDMLYVQGDVENTSGAAGESAGLIHELKPVQQIVDETIKGFWREIDRLAALRR